MTEQRFDPRPILESAIATTSLTVAAVRPDQLDGPTPCPEMNVRAMLGHLVNVLDRIAALGNGTDPFAVTEPTVSDDGWSEAWSAATVGATDAWSDDAMLDKPMALPWIQGTGAEMLASWLSELSVHTWDLAVATGQQPDWDDAVIAAALDARDFLPAENRLALFEEIAASMGIDEVAVPFAEQIAIADDAPAIDRLVAWNGRDPRS